MYSEVLGRGFLFCSGVFWFRKFVFGGVGEGISIFVRKVILFRFRFFGFEYFIGLCFLGVILVFE